MFSNLFPRENLVGGTKRLKNLSELLSSTVLETSSYGPEDDEAGPGDMHNGSYHCQRFPEKNKCEVCSFAIHARISSICWPPASQRTNIRWFINVVVDKFCELIC